MPMLQPLHVTQVFITDHEFNGPFEMTSQNKKDGYSVGTVCVVK